MYVFVAAFVLCVEHSHRPRVGRVQIRASLLCTYHASAHPHRQVSSLLSRYLCINYPYNPHTFSGPTSLDDHVLRYAAVEESALVVHRYLDVKNKAGVAGQPASECNCQLAKAG